MSVVGFIRRCREAGMDWDLAMSAAEAFEAEMPTVASTLTTRQERNRRYYEAKRLKASESKTVKTDQDVSDAIKTASDAEPPPSCARVVEPTSSLRSEGNPPTHPSGASPDKPKRTTVRSRLVPDGWQPPPKVMADLSVQGFTPGEIERELANFRDHEFRDPKTAWDLAFRRWMRTSRNFSPRKAHERPHPDAKFAARQAALAVHERGADLAARLHRDR